MKIAILGAGRMGASWQALLPAAALIATLSTPGKNM